VRHDDALERPPEFIGSLTIQRRGASSSLVGSCQLKKSDYLDFIAQMIGGSRYERNHPNLSAGFS
jgi:hypothetical protein